MCPVSLSQGQERMAHTKSFLYYSLLAALVVMPSDSYSAVKVTNKSRSYSDAYNQVNDMRASVAAPALSSAHSDDLGVAGKTQDSSLAVNLPIRVADQTLARQVASGTSTGLTVQQLANCGAVYPDGEFAWDTPTAGTMIGDDKCVSVVEMRGYQMGQDGSDLVLARVNLAAGDAIKCNISAWPETSYLPAAGTIEFPADKEPSVEDVIAVMNQEQKQNAAFKIVAGTLAMAAAGNVLGANDVGNDSLFGTNKEKLTTTAVGGLAGAAMMTGNVYGGKVAGDMILSTGVNMTAGGLIGNMAGGNDRVLRIENCSYNNKETKCLWGRVIKEGTRDRDKEYFYNIVDHLIYKCDKKAATDPYYKNCVLFGQELVDIMPEGYAGRKNSKDETYTFDMIVNDDKFQSATNSYRLTKDENEIDVMSPVPGRPSPGGANRFVRLDTFKIVDSSDPAMVVDFKDQLFGIKDWKSNMCTDTKLKGRDGKGQPIELPVGYTCANFYPSYQSASDGSLIDMGNKARMKSTLIGAGAGGAIGAFSAYQGAQDDIQERWVTAVREYKDSLQKIYCVTGTRFLSRYNDTVIIPTVTE